MDRLNNIRLVAVPDDKDFPTHVVMPGHRTSIPLTAAISELPHDVSSKYARSQISAALKFFDWYSDKSRGGREDHEKLALIGAFKGYLRTLKCRVKKMQGDQHFTISPPAEKVAMLKATCIGLSSLYRIICDNGYRQSGSPFELSADEQRRQRLRLAEADRKNSLKRRAALSTSLFRVARVEYCPPRRTLVELVADAPDKARHAGWPLSLQLYLKVLHQAGTRPSEPAEMTMLDWYIASRFEMKIKAVSKGSAGRRVKTAQFSAKLAEELREYVNHDRRALVPGALTLAEYLRLGDEGRHELPRDQYIFVNSRGERWHYEVIRRRYWNPTIRDTSLDAATGLPPLTLPTMHWLRHLYVYSFLAMIESSGFTDAEKDRKKEELREYMGWSVETAMLSIYGREFDEERVANTIAEHIEHRLKAAKKIAAGVPIARAPAPTPVRSASQSRMFRPRS